MAQRRYTDQELFQLVLAADEEAFLAGDDPSDRSWKVPMTVMRQIGFESYIAGGPGTPPEFEKLRSLHAVLYRRTDTGIGGVHMGAFMFRDVFTKIEVPLIFGQVGIDPLKMTDLTPDQAHWLMTRPVDRAAFIDQFIDVFDFGYGLMELGRDRPVTSECRNMLGLAHFQLQAAAAVVTGAFDRRGAVQSALIACELALKGGLAAASVDEGVRRNLGHDLTALARLLGECEPGFEAARAVPAVQALPAYVHNRYASEQPDRRQTGRILMTAQYIAAEVMRSLSSRNFRADMQSMPARTWPPLVVSSDAPTA
ncbi:hypothetical protein ACN2C7_05165 [Caulobacter sp. ErkDOM-E]|uniref:hypothetical protein n=1 Tax=Caulobacter sp. ErkDOM-E TaxID=3402778 RepID=UPI003AF44B82